METEHRHQAVAAWMVSAIAHLLLLITLVMCVFPGGSEESLQLLVVSPQQPGDELVVQDVAISTIPVERETALLDVIGQLTAAAPQIDHPQGDVASGAGVLGQHAAAAGTRTGAEGGRGQATFFGTVAQGDRFAYILDASGSMREGNWRRLRRATRELIRSIDQLHEDQFFYVFLFSSATRRIFDERTAPSWLPASAENKERFRDWIRTVEPGGATYPQEALFLALQLQPSAVFLLSDGDFSKLRPHDPAAFMNTPAHRVVQQVSGNSVPVHTIAFEERSGRAKLKVLSKRTGGDFRFVKSLREQFREEYDALLSRLKDEAGGTEEMRDALRWLSSGDRLLLTGNRRAIDHYDRVLRDYPHSTVAATVRKRFEWLRAEAWFGTGRR